MDGRSDIFSLGVVLYESLTGGRAFAGPSVIDVLHAIINAAPRPAIEANPELPVEVLDLFDKALAEDSGQQVPAARRGFRAGPASIQGRIRERRSSKPAAAQLPATRAPLDCSAIPRGCDHRPRARVRRRVAAVRVSPYLVDFEWNGKRDAGPADE